MLTKESEIFFDGTFVVETSNTTDEEVTTEKDFKEIKLLELNFFHDYIDQFVKSDKLKEKVTKSFSSSNKPSLTQKLLDWFSRRGIFTDYISSTVTVEDTLYCAGVPKNLVWLDSSLYSMFFPRVGSSREASSLFRVFFAATSVSMMGNTVTWIHDKETTARMMEEGASLLELVNNNALSFSRWFDLVRQDKLKLEQVFRMANSFR
jgi:hypothetical protein